MLRFPLITIFGIALNANLAGYTAAVPNRFVSHPLVSSVQVSSVTKTLASGSVSPGKRLIASASGTSGVLNSGQALAANQSLTSPSGQYSLVCQSDGNLVLYDNSTSSAYWASQTAGTAVRECIMQSDGNLVVYGNSRAVWASGTPGNAGAYLRVQDDRNVVIYAANNRVLWQANTSVNAQQVINYAKNYYGTVSSPELSNAIKNIANKGYSISSIAFTPQGGFVIIYRVNNFTFLTNFGFSYNNIPQEAVNELTYLASQPGGDNVDDIAFAPQGGFVIVHNLGHNCYTSSDTPQALSNKITTVFKVTSQVNKVVFTPQGGVVFLNRVNKFYYSEDIPQTLRDQITAIQNIQFVNITSFTITPQGGLVATTDSVNTPYYYVNIPQALADKIQTLSPKFRVDSLTFTPSLYIRVIAFTPSNDWVIIAD